MVWKQQRNTKMCETVNPFQCVSVQDPFWVKHSKPHFQLILFSHVSLCFSLFLFWFFVFWLCFPSVSLWIFLNLNSCLINFAQAAFYVACFGIGTHCFGIGTPPKMMIPSLCSTNMIQPKQNTEFNFTQFSCKRPIVFKTHGIMGWCSYMRSTNPQSKKL